LTENFGAAFFFDAAFFFGSGGGCAKRKTSPWETALERRYRSLGICSRTGARLARMRARPRAWSLALYR
jgi:hypothetical protein